LKKIFLVVIILLFSSALFAQRSEQLITCHVNGVSFDEFCSYIYQKTAIKIFYDENWVKDIKVTIDKDSITAFMAVKEALKASKLEVSWWNENLIILPGVKLLTSLPVYESKKKNIPLNGSNGSKLTKSEQQYMTGRRADAIPVLKIGSYGSAKAGSKAKIRGRILDQETGEPIFNATLNIAEIRTGALSDIDGFVSMSLNPGKYQASFEYLGYEKKKYVLEILSDGSFSVNMVKSVIQMKEYVLYGDRQMSIRAKDPGLDKLTIKAIKELPMMMGERDILKISGTLPGIVSVGEGSAGLNVRGGGSDQNAFYINKIPIYNTSHLFGFFPAFNSDIIKDFSIYKGHIPSMYGGHLSSVFNINARQGNRKHITARGGLSPITGNIVVEGPIKKDVASFLFSARSSYSNWILKKVKDPDISNSSARFNDLSGGINYELDKTQLSIFAYRSYDQFQLSDITSYNYSNNGLSTSVSHNFGSSLRGEFSVIGSQYSFSTIDTQEELTAYEHSYKMGHYEAKTDFKHTLSDKNTLEYGASMILYKLNRGNVLPFGEASLHNRVELGNEQGIESALYVSNVYDVFPWLNITTGFRYAVFTPIGEKTVYTYIPDNAKEQRNIIDTLLFADKQPIKWYHEPDIRIAMNIKTDESGSLKIAFNQMHQNLFMLNTTAAIAPNTQWKLADYHLSPSSSYQYSIGVFRTLSSLGLEASAEVYYKQTRNFAEFKDGADFLNNALVETAVLQGNQKAWGIEFFLKRSLRKVEGWVSYTYSRSMLKIDGGTKWSQTNEGLSYPANFDIPHSLNVVLSYHISRRITLASIFTYQSGKPVTYPISMYYIKGIPVLDYSKRNEYRIPNYVRADLSLTIEGNLKKKKPLHSSVVFSLYNALGRQNPYSVFFKTGDGGIRSYKYSVIGVPIFTATWQFKLGNYASE